MKIFLQAPPTATTKTKEAARPRPVQRRVTKTHDAPIQREMKKPEEEEKPIQQKRMASIQREMKKPEEEEKPIQQKRIDPRYSDLIQAARMNSAVQKQDDPAVVHEAAQVGTSGAGGALPFYDRIQASFGTHDVSDVVAHSDNVAADGARAMGAVAFTTGNHVAFAGAPSIHTAAHEAAHVVQQRAGVQLAGGVGQVGDAYERNADEVASRVVAGQSSEDLLDRVAPRGG